MKTESNSSSQKFPDSAAGSTHPELETTREILERILQGKTLKWEFMGMIVDNPILKIYYPSEAAFMDTCSSKKGGKARTEDGEKMRLEAQGMRAAFLAEFPYGMVGFAIDENP